LKIRPSFFSPAQAAQAELVPSELDLFTFLSSFEILRSRRVIRTG
jgi:hypothetical protein